MRYEAPMISCDQEDGFCGHETIDYYEMCASKVDGVTITSTERSPGWSTQDGEDFCPYHTLNGGDNQ